MSLKTYIESKQHVTPNSDITARWHSRIVAEGLDLMGRRGAEEYLARYGKSIGASKVIGLARCAEINGCQSMAERFWESAYALDPAAADSAAVAPAPAPFVNPRSVGLASRPRTAVADPIPTAPAVTPRVRPRATVAAAFGVLPQLVNVITREEAERLNEDPRYGLQRKYDGERLLTRVARGEATGGNKKGLVRHLPHNLRDAFAKLRDSVTDSELVTITAWLFDLLELDGQSLTNVGYEERHATLVNLIEAAGSPPDLKVVDLIFGTEQKRAAFEELERSGAEGVVYKLLDAGITPGNGHRDQLKFQFRARAAVIAGDRNGSKNSVAIFVFNSEGTKRDMGFLTVPASEGLPQPGDVIEVEYLYVHPGADAKFAQPVYKGRRNDVEPTDCVDSKLRVKEQEQEPAPV